MNRSRLWTLIGIIGAAALARLLPHPPNMTPIAAMALFGGATLRNRWQAFALPLLAMAASDVLLGLTRYGLAALASRPVVYGALALTVVMGLMLRRRRTPATIGAAALGSSLLFFVVTNFSVWLGSVYYPPTWEGLVACYTAALPFFRNTLVGNLAFSLVLFGGFALAERRFPRLQAAAGGQPG